MLSKLDIENFKSISHQTFTLKPLTILTGLNSTGKSSLIQSILLLSKSYSNTKQDVLVSLVAFISDFREIRNKYENAKSLTIKADEYSLCMDNETLKITPDEKQSQKLDYEENLYYLSANRMGQEEIAKLSNEQKTGLNGEYIFGYFEKNKDTLLEKSLIKFPKAGHTLKAQLNEWLQYILDLPISLQTEKITSNNIKISFSSDGIDAINPFNLGAGNSYLAKILIVTLLCKKGDLFLIENPEIHLHPKAQSRLGEFFSCTAHAGIQLIVETHSEHLINKVRYQIYDSDLADNEAVIYYKPSIRDDFIQLSIDKNGKYIDVKGKPVMFPSGFFDSTLQDLLEIG